MDTLRVETVTFTARVELTSGRVLTGKMYMPTATRHLRPMRPDERLNDPDAFLPFSGEDGVTALLNKEHVVAVAVPLEEAQRFGTIPPPPLAVRLVSIDCGDRHYEGRVVCDDGPGARRVLDLVNRKERFLALETEREQVIVNKAAIVRIVELGEELAEAAPHSSVPHSTDAVN